MQLSNWCYFQDAKVNLNWGADVCTCLSPSLMFIWLCVDGVSFVLVLLSESKLLCQPLEESRPLLETCKVKDSMVVAGNKQVNTPDTDASLQLIKNLREYFGSCMPWNKWCKEKGALIYRHPTLKLVMKIFYYLSQYLAISVRLLKLLTSNIINISSWAMCKLFDKTSFH